MIRAALLSLAALALAAPAFAQTVVSSDWIRLGDVAPVTGEAAKLIVSPAPPPGDTIALDPAFLIAAAKKSGVILAIPLDKPIQVKRAALQATAAPVAKTPPQALAAPTAPRAPVAGATQAVAAQVLVLVRDIPRGQLVSDSDLDWADATTIHAPRTALVDASAIVGRETRRPLRAGVHILASDIKTPTLVRKGEGVTLIYESKGVRLVTDGQALNDASLGENVRILNKYSKRSIDAVASAQGEARVQR